MARPARVLPGEVHRFGGGLPRERLRVHTIRRRPENLPWDDAGDQGGEVDNGVAGAHVRLEIAGGDAAGGLGHA